MSERESRPLTDPGESVAGASPVERATRAVAALELDTGRPETTTLLCALGAATVDSLCVAPTASGRSEGES